MTKQEIDFDDIEQGDKIPADSVHTGHSHERTPSDPPETDSPHYDYKSGMPYSVHSRDSHRDTTTAVLYDPKCELYAVVSSAKPIVQWSVKSVGETICAEHIDHNDKFEEHHREIAGEDANKPVKAAIKWWETDALAQIVNGDEAFYWDGSYSQGEYSAIDMEGTVTLRLVAED